MSEINSATHWIIKNGKKIYVECRFQNPVKCFKEGSLIPIEFPPEVNVETYHKTHNRAPNGAYWKFDCNWVQKMIYQNCWEGDDGNGTDCTFWDRVLFKKCYDLGSITNQPQSLLALVSAFTIIYLAFE